MIDNLYNSKTTGIMGNIVGTYVKLFTFITALMAGGNPEITAMLYFHAMLNHLKQGVGKYRNSNKNMELKPLVIFDHFESLPALLKHCKSEKNNEIISFIIYSISQFSSSICHDNNLAHVLFVGNQLFTSDSIDNHKSCKEYLSDSIFKHCEYWSIRGINKNDAAQYITNKINHKMNNTSTNFTDINTLSENIINCIGTKPIDIEKSVQNIFSNMDSYNETNHEQWMAQLSKNVNDYIECQTQNKLDSYSIILNENDNFRQFYNNVKQNNNSKLDWNKTISRYFTTDNDKQILSSLMDNGIISRIHGKSLASNEHELNEIKSFGKSNNIYLETSF